MKQAEDLGAFRANAEQQDVRETANTPEAQAIHRDPIRLRHRSDSVEALVDLIAKTVSTLMGAFAMS